MVETEGKKVRGWAGVRKGGVEKQIQKLSLNRKGESEKRKKII